MEIAQDTIELTPKSAMLPTNMTSVSSRKAP